MSETPEKYGGDEAIDAMNNLVIGRGTGYRVECPTCGMVGPMAHSPIAASESFVRVQKSILDLAEGI